MGSLEALMQDFDLLFSNVFNNKYHFTSMSDCDVKYPVFDQRFNDDEQQIIIAATGASKKDFEISLTDDILSVKRVNGSDVVGNEKYKYVKNNISRKKFDIAFKIPKKWDAENLNVQLEQGELIITIPVKEEEKPKIKDFSIG
jgi:HSP20 family protein